MIFAAALALLLSILICAPAWYVANKRTGWYPWDYLTAGAALPIWILLSIFQIGHQSMGNLVEIPVILLFPGLLLNTRVFLGRYLGVAAERQSMGCFVLLVMLVIAVRIFSPEIPE